jgi:hypothetical protein
MTDYSWNIQDRSALSMVVYARQYNRDVSAWRRVLWENLNDLNNRTVILLPSWNTLENRFDSRGDEIQTRESLRELFEIFQEETDLVRGLPNVLVFDDVIANPKDVCDELYNCENVSIQSMGKILSDHVLSSGKKELSPVTFSLTGSSFQGVDPKIMRHPSERNYYSKIMSGVLKNIKDELCGDNEYELPQDIDTTRRFIFTQDSCISYIHTMVRNGVMNVHVVCRSSDVVNTFPHDLIFLHYLMFQVHQQLGLDLGMMWTMRVTLNSAHIVDFELYN